MIVGEAEVQGQVRRAYEAALEAGTTGPMTNRLFSAALQAGKRVRTETGIARERVSISSVAVDLAREVVGDLESRSVIIIGAGETAELTAQALVDQGVRTVFVANRHADRARSLAERFGGEVGSLDSLPGAPATRPTSSSPRPPRRTRSSRPTTSPRSCAVRDGRPLVLIDIAVPRDIEHACGELDGVSVYDMDDLQAVVKRNLSVREAERSRAEAVVEEEIQRFARWLAQLDVMPTIAALREHGAEIVDQVLAENAGPLGDAVAARPRARRGRGARGHAAAAARADDPPEGERARPPAGPARALRARRGAREAPAPPAETAPEAPAADNVRPLKRRA